MSTTSSIDNDDDDQPNSPPPLDDDGRVVITSSTMMDNNDNNDDDNSNSNIEETIDDDDGDGGENNGKDDDYYLNKDKIALIEHDEKDDDEEESLVKCGTTKGHFIIHLYKKWSPNGYDRAIYLFQSGFMDHTHFFRVVPNFLVQFGITYNQNPELRKLHFNTIQDDPQLNPRIKFEPGVVSFAGGGPNSRSSQLFISYGSAASLGTQLWETPLGKVIEGMDNVNNFYSEYGDMPPWGHGPEQHLIRSQGLKYMNDKYPNMDHFTTCKVEKIIKESKTQQQSKIAAAAAQRKEKDDVGLPSSVAARSSIRRSQQQPQQQQQVLNNEAVTTNIKHHIVSGEGATIPMILSKQSESLPLPAFIGGIIICGSILIFFIRIIVTKRSKLQAKVS